MSEQTSKESGNHREPTYRVGVGGGSVGMSGSLTMKQEVHWDDRSWTVSGIILTLWATLFFGACSLNRLHWGLNIVVSAGVLVGLFLIVWLLRRHILTSLRWLDRSFRFRRTFHSD